MYDIIIIGGGAAGLSAAIFASRERSKVLLIDKGAEHGLLGRLSAVTDLPGLDNLSGAEVLEKMRAQAADLGAEIKQASVTSCSFAEGLKRITTNEPATYEARSVILATGNMPHHDSHVYPGEAELRGKGVSHDVDIDAPACKGATVALVGKSVSAAESALKLASFAKDVLWAIPASKLDVPEDIKSRLEKQTKITPFFSSSLKKINGTSEVSSITFLSGGQEKTMGARYVFLPPQPYKPAIDFLNGSNIQLGPDGSVMVTQTLETSHRNVFAAGNVLCTKPQVTVICAAQGAIAALSAVKAATAG